MNTRKKTKKIFLEIIMFLFSLVYIIPAWMVLVNSFKPSKEAFKLSFTVPEKWVFQNYIVAIQEGGLIRSLFNGLFIACVTIFISVIFTSLAAFIMARRSTKVTNGVYNYFVIGIIIPTSIVPTFLLFKLLNLSNTYTGLIFLFIALTIPLSIFLYTGFIKTIPKELDEAAIIDGCSTLKLFYQIIFPLLKPITASIVVFNFVGIWNDIQNQLFFAQSDKWMLPLSVYKFYGTYTYDWNLIFADVVLCLIPLLIIYVFSQKYIVAGMTMGAVKG